MAKNSQEGNRERAARRRAALAERGIKQILLMAPEQAHPLLKQAAGLMTRDDDPFEPRAALRQAGGANQPEVVEVSSDVISELDAAKAQIERQAEVRQIEIEAAEARERALQADNDAARAAEAEAQENARTAVRAAYEADQRATEAKMEAKRALAPVHRLKTMPGIRGRLARWIADVQPDKIE